MSTTPPADVTLEDLLPHRDTMLLVKEILAVDDTSARTRFCVDRSWPMADEQGVPSLILVEMAAQTAGVCNGYHRIRTQGPGSSAMGWLVGVKKAEFFIDSLPLGSVITGSSENTYNFENLREVSCEMYLEDRLIGTATLQLFQAQTS